MNLCANRVYYVNFVIQVDARGPRYGIDVSRMTKRQGHQTGQ